MKFSKKSSSFVNKMLNNVYLLYVIAFIALIDVLGYIMRHEFSAVLFFYLIGTIAFYYTKNMSVVLLTSILGTSVLHLIKNLMGFREGMKEGINDSTEEESSETGESSKQKKSSEQKASSEKKALSEQKASSEQKALSEQKASSESSEPKNSVEKKDGYQNQLKLKPSLYNLPSKDAITKQLGEADKMEKAYDNLEKIVGEKGFQSVSQSTKDLIKQQDKLLKGLKDITPALNEAMGSIGKIDFKKLGGMFGSEE